MHRLPDFTKSDAVVERWRSRIPVSGSWIVRVNTNEIQALESLKASKATKCKSGQTGPNCGKGLCGCTSLHDLSGHSGIQSRKVLVCGD